MKTNYTPVNIIGGGLAGCEAAWQLSRFGVPAILHEMRPKESTNAHQTELLAELVCSNSFRSDDSSNNAVGLLHEEMRRSNSIVLKCADKNRVPAGSALAVDRAGFSEMIQECIEKEPLIEVERHEITRIPLDKWDAVIVATGPLTSTPLAQSLHSMTGEDNLAFFDAIAPIVHKDTIDFSIAWLQSRYDKIGSSGDTDAYINCPLNKAQYETFVNELLHAESTEFHEWEKDTPYFESCLPIEIMAERGPETLRFGPMKPVGLTNPHTNEKPYAVVQLRQDNALGTLYNIVGFQTKLKYGEQTRLFQLIPGLQNCSFARLGGIHRNTFINSPRLLDPTLRLKSHDKIRFAGQITGVEGYVESAAIGLLVGQFFGFEKTNQTLNQPPQTTALGALLSHISGGGKEATFQPMNINFGLFPPLDQKLSRKEKRQEITRRALLDLDKWLNDPKLSRSAIEEKSQPAVVI